MKMHNTAQVVASFLHLDQSFTNLYELKFKGRRAVEEIANCCWEREIMRNSIKE